MAGIRGEEQGCEVRSVSCPGCGWGLLVDAGICRPGAWPESRGESKWAEGRGQGQKILVVAPGHFCVCTGWRLSHKVCGP